MQLTQPAARCSMFTHGQVSDEHVRAGDAVRDAGSLPGLPCGTSVAVGVRLPALQVGSGLANGKRVDLVRQVPSSTVRARRDNLPGLAHPAADMVPGHVAPVFQQERDERPEPPEIAGVAQLQHGLALSSQVASGDGQARPGWTLRHRGGGRDVFGRAPGGETGARSVWQGAGLHCRGNPGTPDRPDQAAPYSRRVGCDTGERRFRGNPRGIGGQIGWMEWIQRDCETWIRTRCRGRRRRGTRANHPAPVSSGSQSVEALDSWNLAGECRTPASPGLFERVHVQVQPEKLEVARPAFLQTGGIGGGNQPEPPLHSRAVMRFRGDPGRLHALPHYIWCEVESTAYPV